MNLIQFESSYGPVIDAPFNFITLFKCLQNWKLDYPIFRSKKGTADFFLVKRCGKGWLFKASYADVPSSICLELFGS